MEFAVRPPRPRGPVAVTLVVLWFALAGALAPGPAAADESVQVGAWILISLEGGGMTRVQLLGKLTDGYWVREHEELEPYLIPYDVVHMFMVDTPADETADVVVDLPEPRDLGGVDAKQGVTVDGAATVVDLRSMLGDVQLPPHPTYFVLFDPRTAERFPINSSGEVLTTAPRKMLGRNYDTFVLYDDLGNSYHNDEFWRVVRGGWYDREMMRVKRLKPVSAVLLATGLSTLAAGLAISGINLGLSLRSGEWDYVGIFSGLGVVGISIPLLGFRSPINQEIRRTEAEMYDPDEVYQAAYDYAEAMAGNRRLDGPYWRQRDSFSE